jgi:hypothetical protein
MANNPKVMDNLKPFKKGEDERRWMEGRPKKFTTELAEHGYKLSEVNDSIQAIMAMNETEIKEVLKNNDATMLRRQLQGLSLNHTRRAAFSLWTLC